MDSIEFNPVEPLKYNEYVPLARKERNTKIVLIVLGTIILITAIIVGNHIYQTNAKSRKEKNKI